MTNSVITESSGGGLTSHEVEYQHDLVQSDVATNSAVTNSIYAEKSSAGFIGSQLGDNHGTVQPYIATDSTVTFSVIAECSGGGLTGREAEDHHDLVQSCFVTDFTLTNCANAAGSYASAGHQMEGEHDPEHCAVQPDIATDSNVTYSVIAECSGGGLTGHEA